MIKCSFKANGLRFFLAITLFAISLFFPQRVYAENLPVTATYKSASEYDYPPFSVTDNGQADGFSVDLLKAVAQEIGINVTFKVDQWSTLKEELKRGDIDILPLVGYTAERDADYDFTVPYIVMHGNIFVRKDQTAIDSEDDLQGKEIIVMDGDNAHEYALRMNFTDQLILTKTYEEAFRLLSSGKHDAVLAQSLVGEMIIKDQQFSNLVAVTKLDEDALTPIKVSLSGFEQKFCFAVQEGDKELLSLLNEGLAIVSANGTYTRLYNKWFPFLIDKELSRRQIVLYTSYFVIPILIILLIGFIIIVNREVRRKTRALEQANAKNNILQAELRNQQKLNAVGTLASGVAHEINNPINGIMNYSQLILDELDPKQEIAVYAQEIIHETERVSAIVKNLQQFSRQEKQTYELTNMDEVINQTLSLVRTVIRHDQIQLEVDLADNLPMIWCRSQQIQQVLMNLLTNARDALNAKYPGYHEDKVMILQCRLLTKRDRQWVRILVEDHGVGISQDIQGKIYDPFFTTKGRTEGTGLGLSISYTIVKEHKGELSFTTEPGQRTQFFMDLPVADRYDIEDL